MQAQGSTDRTIPMQLNGEMYAYQPLKKNEKEKHYKYEKEKHKTNIARFNKPRI